MAAGVSLAQTTESAFPRNITSESSSPLNASTVTNFREVESAWPCARRSSGDTAERYGWNRLRVRVRAFASHFRPHAARRKSRKLSHKRNRTARISSDAPIRDRQRTGGTSASGKHRSDAQVAGCAGVTWPDCSSTQVLRGINPLTFIGGGDASAPADLRRAGIAHLFL